MANWEQMETPRSYSVTKLNEDEGPVIPELMSGDLRKEVTHPDLMTACLYFIDNDEIPKEWQMNDANGAWKNLTDEEILVRYGEQGSDITPELFTDHLVAPSYWPCYVIEKEETGGYIIQVFQSPLDDKASWSQLGVPHFITNYPRESIRYFYKPYRSDAHFENAFRHHIEIRDEIFPEQWKNLKENEKESSF